MNAPVTLKSGCAARARDSLHGLALGDAFGQTWFHIPAGEAERRLAAREVPAGPWPWTDDTAMAVSLYRILISGGTVRQDDLARAFAGAYRADPYRGYGGSSGIHLISAQLAILSAQAAISNAAREPASRRR